MTRETPKMIDDERVGKHFEHSRYGTIYYCSKAVMFNGYKFLTLIEMKNSKKFTIKRLKKQKTISTISWCLSDEADFYLNFMEK